MLSKIDIGVLQFPELALKSSQLHKARGYFGQQFKEFDLLHNHDHQTGKSIYRYPAIQFKIVNHRFSIHAYGNKAIEIFKQIFFKSDRIEIEKRQISIHEKQFEIKQEEFGLKDDFYSYAFISPWIALNQENYIDYMGLEDTESQNNKLNSILINNIISFCKFADYTIPEQIKIKSQFYETKVNVNLKGISHKGFKGRVMLNFLLPDYIGLGKSSSRGYGCLKREVLVESSKLKEINPNF